MEIAQGTVILSPENRQFKRDITPAEALVLHRLHFKNANGSPLGDDFKVYDEALTVDVPAKAAEPEWYNQHTGKQVPAVPAVKAKTHKRTNREEVERLKRKYTGTVKDDAGKSMPVFAAVFGSATMPKLPETFNEIEDAVGKTFPQLERDEKPLSEEDHFKRELLTKGRAAVVQVAIDHKVQVSAADETATIVEAIMEARANTKQVEQKVVEVQPSRKRGKNAEQPEAAAV